MSNLCVISIFVFTQIHREIDFDNDCSQFDCVNAPCSCTHLDNIALGNSVQLTFVSADGAQGKYLIHLNHVEDTQVERLIKTVSQQVIE